MTPQERERHYFDAIDPRLQDLTHRMVEATAMDDAVLQASVHLELTELFEEQARSGYWHPYLTETMADFSEAGVAVAYYECALAEARMLDYPTHTILIDMARQLLELGQTEKAKLYLDEGRAEASRRGDDDFAKAASELLAKASGG